MKTKSFYTGKETLMKLLDYWLERYDTKKIEIHCVKIDEFLTYLYEENGRTQPKSEFTTDHEEEET